MGPELTSEQREIVIGLVDEILREPIPYSLMMELLESLLEEDQLSHASVYRIIDDHTQVLRFRLTSRALLKGIELGRAAGAGE